MTVDNETLAFGIIAILASMCILSTLPNHIKVRNTGTLIMIFWGFIGNFTQGITALMFMNADLNIHESVLRWCDFSGALLYVYPFGFTGGMFCLLRKLESIASTRQVSQNLKDKRKDLVIDLAVGLFMPLLLIPFRLVVQGHRMDIITGLMCITPLYPSIAAIFLSQLPPFLLATSNAILACVVLYWFILRRRQFNALLHSSGTGLTKRRYLRLMSLAFSEILITWPLNIFVFVYNLKDIQALQPYKSWEYVHADFNMVYAYSFEERPTPTKAAIELSRWGGVATAIVFFCFFGLSKESWMENFSTIRKVSDNLRTIFIKRKTGKGDQFTDSIAKKPDGPITSIPLDLEQGKTESIPNTPSSKDWLEVSELPSRQSATHVFISSHQIVSND